MNAREIRQRTDDELTKLSAELRRELWKAQFDNHTNQLDDTSRVRSLRRDIARVETVRTERLHGAPVEAPDEDQTSGTTAGSEE